MSWDLVKKKIKENGGAIKKEYESSFKGAAKELKKGDGKKKGS